MKKLQINFINRTFFTNFYLVITLLFLSTLSFAQNDNRIPFTHRVGNPAPQNNIFKIRGDFAIIGNTNLTLQDQTKVNNSQNEMVYVDIDGDESTLNSSAATLVFSQENGADPNCSEILYAGLYWSGRAKPRVGVEFDVITSSEPGNQVESVSDQEQLVYHLDDVNFTNYSMSISRGGSENNRLPRFNFISNAGGDSFAFEFRNLETNPGRYRIGNGPWITLTNQVVERLDNISILTFDPVEITDGDMTLTFDSMQRINETNAFSEFYRSGLNYIRLSANGEHIPDIVTSVRFDKRKVKIKGPASSEYSVVTASNNNILYPFNDLEDMYVGYTDVTQYVKANGIGEYTIADIALSEGNGGPVGYYGHWGIIVVYENSKMDWRDVTVFDGYSFVLSPNNIDDTTGELKIDGFNAVQNGAVNLKLGVMGGEGERGLSGDYLEIRNAADSEWVRLRHPLNSTNNFFNSSIYTPVRDNAGGLVANPRNPNFLNNTGIDIAMWDVPNPDNSIIANAQTSTTFRYGTNRDVYNIYAIAFSVDSYVPEIQGFNEIVAIGGQNPSENPSVRPGEEIGYSLEIRNLGTEAIENGKLVIPVPFTTTFVSADFEVFFTPNTVNAPYFDPELGPTGSIVWEIGEIPLSENINDVFATLTYTLKATEDCFILTNEECEPFVAINGSLSGKGQISETEFTGIQLTQGFLDGDCEGEPIQEALILNFSGVSEFVQANCSDFNLFLDFEYCNIDPENGVAVSDIRSSFPSGVRFFDGSDATKDKEFDENNPFPAVTGTYYAIPANSSDCIYEFNIQVTIVNSDPINEGADLFEFCLGDDVPNFNTLILPSNQGEDGEYTVFFFTEEEGIDALSGFEVDASTTGTYTIWVAEGSTADCTGPRVPVSITVNNCSFEFEKSGTLVDEDGNGTINAGDKIVYTFTITNNGEVTLTNITIDDPKVEIIGGPLESLAPGESDSTTFSAEYVLTQEDIDSGSFTNIATVTGDYNDKVIEATDEDIQIFTQVGGISILKEAVEETYSVIGDVLNYTITVTNTGNISLTNVSVTDPLTGFEETIPNLAPGQSVVFETSYEVQAGDLTAGSVLNAVFVTAQDPQGNDVTAEDDAIVGATANQIIANDDEFGEFPADFGGVLGRILENDLLNGSPVNFEEVNFEFIELDGIIGLLTNEQGELSLLPGVNEVREYTLKYILRESLNPTNSDEAFVTFRLVESDVNLSVTKTSNGLEIFEGDEFEYEITVANQGSNDATAVEVIDDLPSSVTYVSSRFTASDAGISVNTEVSGSRVRFLVPVLPAGANIVFYIRVKANELNGENPLNITNRVTVSSAEEDTNPLDNVAEDQNQINPFFIPNVITPNGDGKNDRFVIKGLQKFSRTEIVIFNSYGDHVYEDQNYENNWSAQGLVAGTYFYVLKGTNSEGRVHEFKGWIQVIKK
ncbi:DUF7507 domain-containing protein [Aquiflexum lacus]|uniref:DUF7507 domain-containing protein n=1 Tax=Aquiflexum lacus TaxID=2483805 RepID=UPI0018960F6D|nr:gliding motility-associated C-terminal domain-containing protein [Aquiflexum lacus]